MHQNLLLHEIGEEKGFRLTVERSVNSKKCLLYIGNEMLFERYNKAELGYDVIFAEDIYAARNELLNGRFKKQVLPEAIICDLEMEEHLIRHFAGFVAATERLNCIPFIVIGKEKHFVDNGNFESILAIDDIVCYETNATDLHHKIKLLSKYKCYAKKQQSSALVITEKNSFALQSKLSRLVDIVATSIFLTLFSPLFLIIAIAIKIDSRGPVFYISPRAGKGYRIFKFIKFRTMVVDADKKIDQIKELNQYKSEDKTGSVFIKIDQDPRVTKVGRFLRNTSLDELPQLINVLKGDMSLVGNRPLPLYEASSLTIDEAAERFLAPAGITGLWQIKERGQVEVSAKERINLDIEYAKRQSFLYDMQILIKTPMSLKQKTNV